MKTNRIQIKRAQAGFTLVELMIVVAIIGILASIAIPNYQKYQAKARTSEGKIQLAAAYTAEKSFFVEYGSYTSCLASAGFAPDLGTSANPSQRYYAVGFNATVATLDACGPLGTNDCSGSDNWSNGAPSCTSSQEGATDGLPPQLDGGVYWGASRSAQPGASTSNRASAARLPNNMTLSVTAFTIGAAGYIDPRAGAAYDQWSINEGKVVRQVYVGY